MAHAVEGGDELIIVLNIFEDVLMINAAHHDVVDAGARGFAGLSGHSISPNFWQRYEKNVTQMSQRAQIFIIELIYTDMKQDEKWLRKYEEVVAFIKANHRNPSRHRIEEHDMLNWVKANRKVMNKGEMKKERVERFRELMEMMGQYRRKNQWE